MPLSVATWQARLSQQDELQARALFWGSQRGCRVQPLTAQSRPTDAPPIGLCLQDQTTLVLRLGGGIELALAIGGITQ